MIASFIVIALVAFVSLYDYFSTRSWQQVTSTVRNETVFEKRNKNYGAFAIRRDYNRNLVLIMLGVVGGVGVIYAAAAVTRTTPEVVIKPPTVELEGPVIELEKPAIEKPKTEEPVQKTMSPERMIEFRPLVATNDPVTPDPPVTDPNIKAGNQTIIDPNLGEGWKEPGVLGDPNPGKVTEIDPPSGPTLAPDVPAEFPGGRSALITYLSENLKYPEQDAIDGNGGKCYLRFVVDREGNISEVTVTRKIESCPACDKEAMRIVRKMPKWKPGKKKGQPVDSYFNLPITFVPQ